uniref:Immunoglobulin V-set domain-containing protein n=1 Tax=Monopterus albus TaxID=43700 RepID=A0A3Q3IQP9_MONAL
EEELHCCIRKALCWNRAAAVFSLLLIKDNLTLSCSYSDSVDMLCWYQQKTSSSPQLLIVEHEENKPRSSLTHDKATKEFHLQLQEAPHVSSHTISDVCVSGEVTLYTN